MKAYIESLRQFSPDTRLFLISPICIGFSFYGFFVVMFNLYLLRLGYGPKFIGAISSAGLISFIVMSLPAGVMAKRWGSRKLIILGLCLYTLGFSLIPFAEFLPRGWQTSWLVITYMVAFLGGPFYWVNSNLYLMASTQVEHRNHAFSMRTALLPLAGFLGSIIGASFPGFFEMAFSLPSTSIAPYRYALFLSGLLYLPAILTMIRAADLDTQKLIISKPKKPVKPQEGVKEKLPYLLILPIMLVDLLRMAGEVGSWGFFNVFLDDGLGLATLKIGLISGTALLLSGIAALLTPILASRLGNKMIIIAAMLAMAACLVGLAYSNHWLFAGLAYMGIMALSAISMTALSVYRMEIICAYWWSMMSGAAVTGQGLGEAAILLSGGYIIASFGYSSYFLVVALIVFTGSIFFALYFWAKPPA